MTLDVPTCWCCDELFNSIEDPQVGMTVLCANCAALGVMDGTSHIRELTGQEFMLAVQQSAVQAKLAAVYKQMACRSD